MHLQPRGRHRPVPRTHGPWRRPHPAPPWAGLPSDLRKQYLEHCLQVEAERIRYFSCSRGKAVGPWSASVGTESGGLAWRGGAGLGAGGQGRGHRGHRGLGRAAVGTRCKPLGLGPALRVCSAGQRAFPLMPLEAPGPLGAPGRALGLLRGDWPGEDATVAPGPCLGHTTPQSGGYTLN